MRKFLNKENAWVAMLIMCSMMHSGNLYAQKKFIFSWGLSPFTDLVLDDPNSSIRNFPEYEKVDRVFISIATVNFEAKFNIIDFNKKSAISLATAPAFGILNVGNIGEYSSALHYRLMGYLQFDFGNGALHDMEEEKGFGIGAGFEYCKYGLTGGRGAEYFQSFVAPSLRLAYRRMTDNLVTQEFCLTYGLPVNVNGVAYTSQEINGFYESDVRTEFSRKVSSIRLSVVHYLWY